MRRMVFPTLKALPFAIGVVMWIFGSFQDDLIWFIWGHLWIITGMLLRQEFALRRLLTDWPLGEIWASGWESHKRRQRGPSTLRSLPAPDEELPSPRHDRGRFRA